ncbi:AarF/ABC1/UbiB kinase family protein [Streptomyces sp. YIM 98790]|uniref:ABC1 kinase family protein n=1 Tax=Streptomyces sp. YIM 98790 TaxID=2689077 RepID=UPI00140B662B|nr:AarF/UbiB family protein [Streptomyces sp. YIM 98790]
MAAKVGDRLRLVVRILGQLVAAEVGELARDRRWPLPMLREVPPPPQSDPAEDPVSAEQRRAKAVRHALESLGPFYVKLGQILSTRPDMVPPAMIAELQNLHDQVDVRPFSVFEPQLERDLGPDWKYRFDDIDTVEPLGAASLAQVYRARLPGGRRAVVKIQRPGIRASVLADMALLRKAARIVARTAPKFNELIDLEAMLGSVFDAMEPELDFTGEAAHMDTARANIRRHRYRTLQVPEVLHATPRVLVQSMAPGESVRYTDKRAFSERERKEIGRELLSFMYRGYFVDRFFHADPHAGNVFAMPGGPATLIDWGMVGRLDRRTSLQLMPLLMALATNDGHGLARHWAEMGRSTSWANFPAFASDMAAFIPRVSSASLDELNFGVSFTTVLEKATKRGIASAPTISLLGKSFANLEGSVRCLAPELALSEVFQSEVRTILMALVGEMVSLPQLGRMAMELMLAGVVAPDQFRSVLSDAANRRIALDIRHPLPGPAERGAGRGRYAGLLALGALALLLDHRRRIR